MSSKVNAEGDDTEDYGQEQFSSSLPCAEFARLFVAFTDTLCSGRNCVRIGEQV